MKEAVLAGVLLAALVGVGVYEGVIAPRMERNQAIEDCKSLARFQALTNPNIPASETMAKIALCDQN